MVIPLLSRHVQTQRTGIEHIRYCTLSLGANIPTPWMFGIDRLRIHAIARGRRTFQNPLVQAILPFLVGLQCSTIETLVTNFELIVAKVFSIDSDLELNNVSSCVYCLRRCWKHVWLVFQWHISSALHWISTQPESTNRTWPALISTRLDVRRAIAVQALWIVILASWLHGFFALLRILWTINATLTILVCHPIPCFGLVKNSMAPSKWESHCGYDYDQWAHCGEQHAYKFGT
jgi:hypothetical protein